MGEGNITIEAIYKPIPYTCTVRNGTGSGLYQVSSPAAIAADPAPARQDFAGWVIDRVSVGDGGFDDEKNAATNFTINTGGNVTIVATYETVEFEATVLEGAGSGIYREGDIVRISAVPEAGLPFRGWEVVSGLVVFADAGAEETTFIMPGGDVTVRALFGNAPTPPTGQPNPDPNPDPDPEPDDGVRGDVSHLLDTGDHMQYIRGVGHNDFEPERHMTRAEAAQLFYNLLLDKDVEVAVRFSDIPSGAWYEEAVGVLTTLGIITGYPDGSFHPENGITRAEFAVIAVRFALSLPEDIPNLPLSDVPVSHWAYSSINAAVQFGWITGYDDGHFDPDAFITRAQVVTLVNRMLARIADRGYIDRRRDITQFDDVSESYWAYYDIQEAYNAHEYIRLDDGSEEWTDVR